MSTPIKILKGTQNNLPSSKSEGCLYFCTDTGNIYLDISSSHRVQISADAAKRLITDNNTTIDPSDIALKEEVQSWINEKTSVYIRRWEANET